MASISIIKVNQSVSAERNTYAQTSNQAVTVRIESDRLYLSREEAAQLGAELLNAAGAVPAEVAA
jgi:hypothetical protein